MYMGILRGSRSARENLSMPEQRGSLLLYCNVELQHLVHWIQAWSWWLEVFLTCVSVLVANRDAEFAIHFTQFHYLKIRGLV